MVSLTAMAMTIQCILLCAAEKWLTTKKISRVYSTMLTHDPKSSTLYTNLVSETFPRDRVCDKQRSDPRKKSCDSIHIRNSQQWAEGQGGGAESQRRTQNAAFHCHLLSRAYLAMSWGLHFPLPKQQAVIDPDCIRESCPWVIRSHLASC